MTSICVPRAQAAEKLGEVLSFRGIHATDKDIVVECLRILQRQAIDIVDACLVACSRAKGLGGVYSFDRAIASAGLRLLKVA